MPEVEQVIPPIGASVALPERAPVRRILANVAHLLTGKAAAGIISLGYLVIVARALGAERYGILVLVNAYALLIGSVVAFSGFHGVVRYGAIALEEGDRARLARLVRYMAVVELGCGAVAVVIAAAGVALVGPRLGWSVEAMRMALPYSLAVLGTVRATPQGLLQLAGRFDLVGVHQTVSPVVRLAGTLLVWSLGGGLAGYLGVWLASSIAEGAAMWLLARGSWRRLMAGAPVLGAWRGAARENAGFVRFILTINFDITLRELAPQLVPLTVGGMMGPAAAGLLALAQRATNVLQQPAVLLASGSYAVLADLAARGDRRAMARAVWRSVGLTAIGSLALLAGLALLGGRLLVWIGGGSFAGGTGLMLLIAVGRALFLVAVPLGTALTALGRPDRSVAAALVSNIALYPLLPLMLSWLGEKGAGVHAIVQTAAAGLMLALFFRREGAAVRA